MNLEDYFRRIGFHSSYDKLDLATLKLIHKQHIMSIPYENLSIHCGETVTLDLEVIYHKLVRSSRGGWCMENNLLFGWMLRELGYDTTILSSRVFSRTLNMFDPEEGHLINKVVIDGKAYIVDVGYGFPSWEPLELVSGRDQPLAAGVFRLINKGEMWMLEKTGRKPVVLDPKFANSSMIDKNRIQQMYCFTLEPREVDHFSKINHKLQTDPSSLFTKKSMCSLQTAMGYKSLVGLTYCEITYQPEEGVDIFDLRDVTEGEIEDILEQQFKVKLKSKLQPTNKKL